jgi:hypothetical protein
MNSKYKNYNFRDLNFAKRLLNVTIDCKEDMHEPDENGVSAKVFGNHLDNAMGDDPETNCKEYTVEILRDAEELEKEYFNLADLIALARVGAIYILNENEE